MRSYITTCSKYVVYSILPEVFYEHQTVLTSSEITLIMYCTVNLFYCETFPDAMTMGPCMYRPWVFFSLIMRPKADERCVP